VWHDTEIYSYSLLSVSLCRTSSVLLALDSFLLSFSSSTSLCLNCAFASCLAVLSVNSRSIIACGERGFNCLDESLETLVLVFFFLLYLYFFKYSLCCACAREKNFDVILKSMFKVVSLFG